MLFLSKFNQKQMYSDSFKISDANVRANLT